MVVCTVVNPGLSNSQLTYSDAHLGAFKQQHTSLGTDWHICLEEPKSEFQDVTLTEPKGRTELNETKLPLIG